MNKELFVSSTPHETRVGMTEDDQLAEIYLERENEYTLAGSIYKGRVTRVLPGMQSAFVDIGLERDAFLYVSDFMEVEEGDEVEEVPTSRQVFSEPPTQALPQPRAEVHTERVHAEREEPVPASENQPPAIEVSEAQQATGAIREPGNRAENQRDRDGRGGWGGRRRRRGRRGERFPESKFARTPAEARPARTEHAEYGPPPGYQPMILPGESISKYQRLSPSESRTTEHHAEVTPPEGEQDPGLSARFPEDEPMFTAAAEHLRVADVQELADVQEKDRHEAHEQPRTSFSEMETHTETASERERDHEDERLGHEDVAAARREIEGRSQEEHQPQAASATAFGFEPTETALPAVQAGSAGTMEEEEIEEEEADLASYVEELEEDAAFDEMEEETRAAEDYQQPHEITASSEPAVERPEVPRGDEFSPVAAEAEEEVDEAAEEEAELDEAQAEAEAALDAEARGDGTVDARVEVRAPAATAGYTQRAQRPGFDRRGGRGRRGGRRFQRREPQNIPQITDLLKEGQEILVQIAKEPIGKKGARITSHIALPGRFLVYMPTVNHTGVSRKIASEEERQRLKRIIMSERENGHGGFIVRTAAQGASEDELRADIRFLKGLWAEIRNRADNGKGPTLIYHDLNVVERVLRDQVTSDVSAIWVDNEQEYERILRFANRFQPALVKRVKLYTKETPLFEQFGLREEIDKALKSKVWLKSGGYIVINQTEALVAIDVNTGKYVGKTARLEDTIVKTNVDAIKEIVRQIRLRDLGGIIVIDFIDMDERRNRQKVMQALEEALRADRAPSKVLQFNDFGLVAITRKRVKQSLERTIGAPCPYCTGTGFVKSVISVCNEIYTEMRKIAKHLEHSDVMLRVHPEVAKALKANNGRALNEMEELTKRTIIVKSDPALHQEQFDIN